MCAKPARDGDPDLGSRIYVQPESGRGLPHSMTLARSSMRIETVRQLLDCASPLALSHARFETPARDQFPRRTCVQRESGRGLPHSTTLPRRSMRIETVRQAREQVTFARRIRQ